LKKYRSYFIDLLFIIAGCAATALGITMFLSPNRISSGGVSSIGTVLLHLFGVRMSLTNLIANAVLFILGYRYLGKYAIVKTVEGIVFLTLFLELTGYLPAFTDDMMLATVVGGVLVGGGIGLCVRRGASTGGSDFAALIIKRFLPHISLANLILVIDCAIIVVSGIVFRSLTVTIFSVIAMYISSKVCDAIVLLGDAAKKIEIFSSKYDEISGHIMAKFERGVTGIHSTGMYSGEEKVMVMCVVSPKELPLVVSSVREIDRDAFIIITDVKEVLGEGFKQKSDYDSST